MIDYQVLRGLVFESLKANPLTQFEKIMSDVKQLAVRHNVFPTEEECRDHNVDYSYYREKKMNPIDELNVNQIVWDLIIDRVLTVGMNASNQKWPFLRLPEFGHSVVHQAAPTYYDPEGYIAMIESIAPKIDPVIKQYIVEGLHCFRQRLFFAAAVMFGSAAEKAILLLLQSVGNAETNKKKKGDIMQLLERPRLPVIFETLQSELDLLIKTKVIPYTIHQGSTEHIISLFEMIRAQRNDAVHPTAGQVNRTKVFLAIQSLPSSLEVIYRLIKWFTKNKI